MGLLGSILGAGGGKGGGGGALLTQILAHLAGGGGSANRTGAGRTDAGSGGMGGAGMGLPPGIDLGSIIKKFEKGGMGDLTGSWIGMGQNKPVSQDQVTQAFGEDQLKDIAGKLGMRPTEIVDILSRHLPKVVDKLSPKGKIPEGDVSSDLDDLVSNSKFDDLDALIAEYEAKH